MANYYFYKTVRNGHIRGLSLIPGERGGGIKVEGLDPKKRNSSGGATVVAAAQSGRTLSKADKTGVGQCLSGSLAYATDYATDDDHVVLRITLTEHDLPTLTKSAATHEPFARMEDAKAAAECTSISKINIDKIEYSTEIDTWQKISRHNNPKHKNYSADSSDDEDDSWDPN